MDDKLLLILPQFCYFCFLSFWVVTDPRKGISAKSYAPLRHKQIYGPFEEAAGRRAVALSVKQIQVCASKISVFYNFADFYRMK